MALHKQRVYAIVDVLGCFFISGFQLLIEALPEPFALSLQIPRDGVPVEQKHLSMQLGVQVAHFLRLKDVDESGYDGRLHSYAGYALRESFCNLVVVDSRTDQQRETPAKSGCVVILRRQKSKCLFVRVKS